MANKLLLCLVLVCVLTDYSLCGRFSSRSRNRGSSRSGLSLSLGRKSISANKPPRSSLRNNHHSSGSTHPTSRRSSDNYHSPSSDSSHLSGSGHGSQTNPPSNSKLSGSTSSSSEGKPAISGPGSATKYTPSHEVSGTEIPITSLGSQAKPINVTKHNYPTSSTGLSGSVIQNPSHYNPTSSSANSNPPHTSVYTNTPSGFGSGYGYNSHNYYNSYASAPQHIYITEYQNSNSRYSDILTGLALYNLGRSNSNYNHHYYNDDYYTRRYYLSGTFHPSSVRPIDEAYCTLRIKEHNKLEVLKIPCEIVSTFTEGSKKLSPDIETKTVCISNHTVINNTQTPTVNTTSTTNPLNISSLNETILSPSNKTTIPELPANVPTFESILDYILNVTNLPGQVEVSNPSTIFTLTSIIESIPASNISAGITTNRTTTLDVITSTTLPTSQQDTTSTSTAKPLDVVNNATLPHAVTSNITLINSTNCTTTTDPLTIKGPPLNPTNMKCEVDIITKTNRLRTKVDCKVLTEYSKMPEPPKKEPILLS